MHPHLVELHKHLRWMVSGTPNEMKFDEAWDAFVVAHGTDVTYAEAIDYEARELDFDAILESLELDDFAEPARDSSNRHYAYSRLVARQAADDPEVVAFRTRHLRGRTIPHDGLGAWLGKTAESDGPRRTYVTVVLPDGVEVERDPRTGHHLFQPPLGEVSGGIGWSVELLDWAAPGDTWVSRIPVTPGGILDKLRKLSHALANRYGWQPAQALVFIMCGITPIVTVVRRTINLLGPSLGGRIKLEIGPTASLDEVVEAFTNAREAMGWPKRALSAKHVELAAFTGADHTELSWNQRYDLWNETFPEWAYTEASNFRRDAAVAQRRLINPTKGK